MNGVSWVDINITCEKYHPYSGSHLRPSFSTYLTCPSAFWRMANTSAIIQSAAIENTVMTSDEDVTNVKSHSRTIHEGTSKNAMVLLTCGLMVGQVNNILRFLWYVVPINYNLDRDLQRAFKTSDNKEHQDSLNVHDWTSLMRTAAQRSSALCDMMQYQVQTNCEFVDWTYVWGSLEYWGFLGNIKMADRVYQDHMHATLIARHSNDTGGAIISLTLKLESIKSWLWMLLMTNCIK